MTVIVTRSPVKGIANLAFQVKPAHSMVSVTLVLPFGKVFNQTLVVRATSVGQLPILVDIDLVPCLPERDFAVFDDLVIF